MYYLTLFSIPCLSSAKGSILKINGPQGTTHFKYNALNQQTQVITPQKDTLINHYDSEGLRAEIKENQKLTKFIFHQGDIILETDNEDNALSRFTRGYAIASVDIYNNHLILDNKVVEDLDKSRYYYQQDEQYSTAFITDKEGTIKNFYKYDAFGNILESQEALHNRITYTGQQYDAITQQYYLRARFYNPILGRFMQEDPYHGDGLNLYAYCKNNPVMYYDPSGYASKQPSCGDKGDQGPEENGSVGSESSSKENGKTVNKYFPSKRAARRSAYRDAGIGKHGGKTPLDEYLNAGSKHPYKGNRQSRNSWLSEKGHKVAHDKYGHKSNPTAKPHYNVYFKDGRDYHYYYPSDYNPNINK